MSWDGIRRIIWAKELDEMERIGNRHFTVAVPIEADAEFKAMIYAAGVTHSCGNKSIDYIYKRYGGKWREAFSRDRSGGIEELRLTLRTCAVRRADAISALHLPDALPVGYFFAANALIRLHATFQASLQLINAGFAFEAESVIRLGFEQVAWASSIADVGSIEEVMKISPASAIADLKKHFRGAGLIYGRLSEMAHLSPKVHERYVSLDDDELRVSITDPELAKESTLMLMILLDAYLVISERLFHDVGIPSDNLNESGELRDERLVSKLLDKYKNVLPQNANQVFAEWAA